MRVARQECFATFVGTGTTLPAPVVVTTDSFQGCSSTAEQYEGMLVQTGEVTVSECVNPLQTALIEAGVRPDYYCQANLENVAWPSCFDKYKQMWVLSTGASFTPLTVRAARLHIRRTSMPFIHE